MWVLKMHLRPKYVAFYLYQLIIPVYLNIYVETAESFLNYLLRLASDVFSYFYYKHGNSIGARGEISLCPVIR